MPLALLIPVLALLAADPSSFEARKAEIRALLEGEDFSAALAGATKLNRDWPDDVVGYQLLAAARLGLGDYAEAEKACQWMLDMRIGQTDPAGWTLIAHIREATGDLDGAIDAVNTGYALLPVGETGERRAMLTHAGRLQYRAGKLDQASRLLELRLGWGKDADASAALAAVRIAQGRKDEGIALLREVAASNAHPRHLFQLAEATGAAADYTAFESAARAIRSSHRNANRELVVYYAGRANRVGEALTLARAEAERRHDILTLDALAIACKASGNAGEAREIMQRILKTGTRDPEVVRHAAQLGLKP